MGSLFFALFFVFLFFFFYKKTRTQTKKEKELFAFQMAHELRTSLTVLLGYAEVLERLEKLSSSQLREIATKISSSSKKMERTIQSLLLLAKEEKKETRCDLLKSLERCEKELLLLYPQVLLSVEKKEKPLFLLMEEGLLEIALRNLLENAVRYSKKNPKISISFVEKERHVELSIEDEGKGIGQEEQKHIFENFYSSDRKQGCGLGLFIVQKIVERSKGKIFVVSSEGKGSKFSLILPKAT
jgi:signal transduction histidine kinase